MARTLRRAVPTAEDKITTVAWRRSDRCAAAVVISDEPTQRVVIGPRGRLVTWTGYFSGRPDSHRAAALNLLKARDRDAAVDQLGGVFSAAIIDARGAQFHTGTARVEPVYWCEDEQHVYVSSRALGAHLAATDGDVPDYDLGALVGLISAGYFPDESTPFRGAKPLPSAHVLDVTATHVACRHRRREEVPAGEVPLDDVGAELAEVLVESCAALPARGPVRCDLTGGKDSRLIAAALRAAGVGFVTQTAGHPEHPDVVVARRISDVLGVEHICLSPWADAEHDRDSTVVVRPMTRGRDVVQLTEGMLSAYENIAVKLTDAFSPAPVLGGHGGELLRGGFAKYVKELTSDGAAQFFRRGFQRYPSLFQDDAFQAYRRRLRPWLRQIRDDPAPGLGAFYLHYRAGRWSAAARTARTTKQDYHQPFFDDRVVTKARRVPIERRLDEQLIHAVLRHLAPDLVNVPFADHRWRFDTDHPGTAAGHPASETRAPVLVTSNPAATFNWRLRYGNEVQEIIAEQVLGDGPSAMLFEVVDRKVVERLLRRAPPRNPRLSWRLFTASVLLSNTWLKPTTPARAVEVALPSSE